MAPFQLHGLHWAPFELPGGAPAQNFKIPSPGMPPPKILKFLKFLKFWAGASPEEEFGPFEPPPAKPDPRMLVLHIENE